LREQREKEEMKVPLHNYSLVIGGRTTAKEYLGRRGQKKIPDRKKSIRDSPVYPQK
jgi:hypothetical protein